MTSFILSQMLIIGGILGPLVVVDHLGKRHEFKVTKENIAKCDALVKYIENKKEKSKKYIKCLEKHNVK